MIDPLTVGLASLAILLVLILLRVPIAVALLAVSFGGIWAAVGQAPAMSILSNVPYDFAASWTLSSVPMYLLMGYLAYHFGLTRELFAAARAWLSWLPGGLVIASLAGSGGFAAVTGSSVACSAAIGKIALPEMRASRYHMGLSAGSIAAGGTLGALIPPSILLILYGIQAQIPITELFARGLAVGLCSLALYAGVVLIIALRRPDLLPRGLPSTMEERLRTLPGVLPVLAIFGVVFGGLFAGFFSATESGAVGATAVFIAGVLRRRLTRRALVDSVTDTLLACGSLFLIAVGANALARLMALTGLSAEFGDLVAVFGDNRILFLLVVTGLYLVIGMFMEPVSAMLLTLPILIPILGTMGIDMVFFGLLLAKVLEVGMISPPVGLNVFVVHGVARDLVSLEKIFLGLLPFLAMDLLLIAVMIALAY